MRIKKSIKESHDFKHWLKIYKGKTKKALKAFEENTIGFCCFYDDTMKKNRDRKIH